MSDHIHPTAIVEPGAEIGPGVRIGAHAYVGPRVVLGEGCVLHHRATVTGKTRMGRENVVHPGAVIGGEPQDLKFSGEDSCLEIGDNNTFRECTTVNLGTAAGGGQTVIGNQCLVMAYAHIAHDCILGDRVVLANCAQLAGHIKVEDQAVISGMVAIHHFVTVGRLSFVAAFAAVRNDVPPYMIVDGTPARVRKLNLEGLKRRNTPQASLKALRSAFKMIYRSDLSRAEAIEKIEALDLAQEPCVRNLIAHYHASGAGCQGRALEAFRQDKSGPMRGTAE